MHLLGTGVALCALSLQSAPLNPTAQRQEPLAGSQLPWSGPEQLFR